MAVIPHSQLLEQLKVERLRFPDLRRAPTDYPLAIGGDLQPLTLLAAYSCGIFPWSVDPISWWSPDPRAHLPLSGFHVSRRLARKVRQGRLRVTFNQAFAAVMQQCSVPKPGRDGTWISPPFLRAYQRLHELGYAHSVETWADKKLVGGVYGVTVGGLFAGESMFHSMTDAGKIALVHLVKRLCERGFMLFDTQMVTDSTAQFGCCPITRKRYLELLTKAIQQDCRFI